MYGEIKVYAGSGSPELAQKIADYLQQRLSPREIIQFPNENIFIKLNGSGHGQDVFRDSDHIFTGTLQFDGTLDYDPDDPFRFCKAHHRSCSLPLLWALG